MRLNRLALSIILTLLLIIVPTFGKNNNVTVSAASPRNTLPEVEIVAKRLPKGSTTRLRSGEFLGFQLEGRQNTNVSAKLIEALQDYTGPKVMITSLRRNYNCKSAHYHGNAVDLQWRTDLIEWIVSEEGLSWVSKYGITFYIEGRPGSKALIPYKKDERYSKYVFENPNATGNHIHIQL